MNLETPVRSLARPDGAALAYQRIDGAGDGRPGVIFLGGFASDMTGAKATALADHCRARGLACLRFDYFGHGRSAGRLRDGTVGRWTDDALAVLDQLGTGPQILVGSSLGGWIMLLAALARPARIAGLVGIAAAPDFTEDLIWAKLAREQQQWLWRDGMLLVPSNYGEAPYEIGRALISEGRKHLLLRRPIAIDCPVRLLHGMLDPDVPWRTALRLAARLTGRDVAVTLIKDGDHRLSRAADIARMLAAVDELAG